ncbi:MAG: hypothetical protein HYU02_08285 [Thaumarchaeota archaeon]|nr:hypothetical protein [Nitrososphaerota archaeon]
MSEPQVSLEDRARKIHLLLSNSDASLIFSLGSKGIPASLSILEKYKFSKKRYYTRLKELLDLGLIFKDKEFYRHTAIGALIYENAVDGLKHILVNHKSIEMLQSLKQSVKDSDDLDAVDRISHEVLKDLESRFGLSGLKPVRLFRSWDDLSAEVADSIDKMRSKMYVASKYVDFRTAEAALRSASRGCKINIINTTSAGLSTRLMIMSNLVAHPNTFKVYRDLAENSNVSMRVVEIPFSFIVIDELDVGVEIVDPLDPQSFFAGVQFRSPILAGRMISYFNHLWGLGSTDPLVKMLKIPIEELLKRETENK